MSYRGPQPARQNRQHIDHHMTFAGHTATWRQWVSSDDGIPVAGIGASAYYREQQITALMGAALQGDTPRIGERQTLAGMVAEGAIEMVTRQKMGRQDEVRWQGDIYRVEADSVWSPVAGSFVTVIKRGQ